MDRLTYITIENSIHDRMTFVKISTYEPGKEMLLIDNQTELEIRYGQKGYPRLRLAPFSKVPFGWDEPLKDHDMVISYKVFDASHEDSIPMNFINKTKDMIDTCYAYKTELQGQTRTLTLAPKKNMITKDHDEDHFLSIINVSISRLGISIISNFNEPVSKELFFISLRDFKIVLAKNESSDHY